ncbi:hypothetical protein BU15DRAFT_90927 [Melanogaster broomeanus]|nr:hypothetical protein BU15DRAFT_90927 [Melanogaster broomeanus]
MEQLLAVTLQRGPPKWRWIVATLFMVSQVPGYAAQSLTDQQVSVVSQRLAEGASHSWEYGTRAEVLLEFNAPTYSVLYSSPVPPPQEVPSDLTSSLSNVFAIAHTIVANRSISNGNVTGPQPLIQDTSAGDPASIGVAVLLANWTGQRTVDGLDYAGAARDQVEFLFQDVPKSVDGAISHRMSQVQLWSDFVYMVPPFLAYYGVVTQNQTVLQEAYNQISLYRKYLRDTSCNNLWKHIQLGSSGQMMDIGNAWAAAGMIRVLGTIQQSQYAKSFQSQQKDLANWVKEIHGGMYPYIVPGYSTTTPIIRTTFLDASSTALLASTVYRLSLLSGVHTYIPFAEVSRKSLSASAKGSNSISASAPSTTSSLSTSSPTSPSSPGTPGLLHFSSDGWLTPVVDPYSYPDPGQDSPEGQAFVLSMQAAWKDWVSDGSLGANSSPRGMKLGTSVWIASFRRCVKLFAMAVTLLTY